MVPFLFSQWALKFHEASEDDDAGDSRQSNITFKDIRGSRGIWLEKPMARDTRLGEHTAARAYSCQSTPLSRHTVARAHRCYGTSLLAHTAAEHISSGRMASSLNNSRRIGETMRNATFGKTPSRPTATSRILSASKCFRLTTHNLSRQHRANSTVTRKSV